MIVVVVVVVVTAVASAAAVPGMTAGLVFLGGLRCPRCCRMI